MPDALMRPLVGDRAKWISKTTHPKCYGVVAVWYRNSYGTMTLRLPLKAKKLDPTMGPNWGNTPNAWWQYTDEPFEVETNEWGEVSP